MQTVNDLVKRRGHLFLALATLLSLTAGCGAALPTSPVLSSASSSGPTRSAGSEALVMGDDPGDGLPPPGPAVTDSTVGGGGILIVGPGRGNHGQKPPKKPKKK